MQSKKKITSQFDEDFTQDVQENVLTKDFSRINKKSYQFKR